MQSNDNVPLCILNKEQLVEMIGVIKTDLLECETKTEDILKGTSRGNNSELEKHIDSCFVLHSKLEEYKERLEEMESKGFQMESPSTLMDFISNISNVKNDLGPEALIVVPCEGVGKQYIQLIRRLRLENVVICTIRALTASEVNVTLKHVNAALLDGSEADLGKFFGSEAVRLVIRCYVPADRLYLVRSNIHREICFEHISHWKLWR